MCNGTDITRLRQLLHCFNFRFTRREERIKFPAREWPVLMPMPETRELHEVERGVKLLSSAANEDMS